MSTLQVARILDETYVEGPGRRVALFLQGCSIGRTQPCPGCQASALFPERGGQAMRVERIVPRLLKHELPITILGGEPMDQAPALFDLLVILKTIRPDTEIIVYSGFTYEELQVKGFDCPAIIGVLALIDVLVDGRYVRAQNTLLTQWRGSENQRPIDLAAMREANTTRLILRDWSVRRQVVFILPNGDMHGTEGVISDLAEEGDTVEASRQCGQPEPGSARTNVVPSA